MTACAPDASSIDLTLPARFAHLDVFVRPLALVEADIRTAYEAQALLAGWRPTTAAVIGAGTRGLLTALALRLRDLDVTLFADGVPTTGAATLGAYIGVGCAQDIGARRFDLVMRTTATGARTSRGVLPSTFPAGVLLTDDLLEAAGRDIVATEGRYPGWLSRLSIASTRINSASDHA